MARYTPDPNATTWFVPMVGPWSIWDDSPGYVAGRSGRPLSENPHDLGTPEHRRWTKEHIQGSKGRHSEAGTHGATAEEKAAAAATDPSTTMPDPVAEILGLDEPELTPIAHPGDVRHLSRPDPTAILDEPPLRFDGEPDPDREMFVPSGTTAVWWVSAAADPSAPTSREIRAGIDLTVFLRAVTDDFTKALQKVTDTMRMPADTGALRDSMNAIASTSKTNRKRHGRAATCPVHGPTRGGTCMKCERGRR